MDLYESIYLRKSVKTFLIEELDYKLLKTIENFANHIQTIIQDERIQYKIINCVTEKKQNVEGLSSAKAPYYFVLTMSKQDGYLLDTGYVMGQMSLFLTTKEIGSYLLRPDDQNISQSSRIDDYVSVLAFGKSKASKYKDAKKVKSLLSEDFCHYKTEVDDNILKIVNAAGFLPSSIGPQPWRLVVYNNRIHIFCKKDTIITKYYKKLHRIKIGMMLANMQLKAEDLWLNVDAKRIDNIAEKQLRNYDYIVSVLIN